MKCIIAGGRDFNDYATLQSVCDKIFKNTKPDEIVSGTARGADSLGELYAKNKKIEVKRFPADWNLHGMRAGIIRNEQMAAYATHLIAFWDGKSKGTKNMIALAKNYNLITRVISY